MDFQLESTFDFKFTSRSGNVPTVLAGSPVVEVYEDNSITQITGSETLTVSFDGVVGFNNLRIVATAANGFEAGKSYAAVFSAGTVGGDSVIGETILNFTVGRTNVTNIQAIVDGVWDEILTGATHNINNSSGKRLRQITSHILADATAQAGTSNTITLAASESSTDGTFDPSLISIVGGTGAGQSRLILEYTGATRVAVVDRNWRVNPSSDSEYVIFGDAGRETTNEGLAQAGTSSTITLNSVAGAVTDTHKDSFVYIRSGTGDDQCRLITAYNGATKVATVSPNWMTNPDSTSAYVVLPHGQPNIWDSVGGGSDGTAPVAATDLGDRKLNSTIDFLFHTTNTGGDPTSLVGSPVISVYKANDLTQTVTGVTLTVEYDGLTGLNHVRIVATDAFYAIANDYHVVVTAGTVNTISWVGRVIATFSVENRRDVLSETDPEPTGVPSATATSAEKLAWIYALSRNKGTQNSTTKTLRNDADSADIGTSAISDDGTTFTRSEWG